MVSGIWFCAFLTAVSSANYGECPDEFEFKCDSNECISLFNVCDGTADCTDASDETTTVCSDDCPSYEFQCEYGACISMGKKCDGIIDCMDLSDELNCVGETDRDSKGGKSKTYSTSHRKQEDITKKGCQIGHLPNIVVSSLTNINKTLNFGNYVHNYEIIQYQCNDGSVPFGDRINYCFNGEWTGEHPVCATTGGMLESIQIFQKKLPNTQMGQIQSHWLSILIHLIKTEDNSANIWNEWMVYYRNQENQKTQSGQIDNELDHIWTFFDMMAYIKNKLIYKTDCIPLKATMEDQYNDKDLFYLLSIIPDFKELSQNEKTEMKLGIDKILSYLEEDEFYEDSEFK